MRLKRAGIKTSDSTRCCGNDKGGIGIQVGEAGGIKAICQAGDIAGVSQRGDQDVKGGVDVQCALDVEPVPA